MFQYFRKTAFAPTKDRPYPKAIIAGISAIPIPTEQTGNMIYNSAPRKIPRRAYYVAGYLRYLKRLLQEGQTPRKEYHKNGYHKRRQKRIIDYIQNNALFLHGRRNFRPVCKTYIV